jgi:hypothetical protein
MQRVVHLLLLVVLIVVVVRVLQGRTPVAVTGS